MARFYELGWMIKGKEDMYDLSTMIILVLPHRTIPELEEKRKREVCFL
jgi:hypothetical protein